MHFKFRIILASISLFTLIQSERATAASYEGFLPKTITEVKAFLKKHPSFDGRNIKIAVLDSGVDPGAPGLSTTSQGLPKVIDILDATGSGDVDTSVIETPNENAQVEGLSGRRLQLDPAWIEPNQVIHLGIVNGFDLFPDYVVDNYKKHAREKMQEMNKNYLDQTQKAIETLAAEKPDYNAKKKDLEDRLELLTRMEESYDAPSPVYDCVLLKISRHWRVVIDTNQDGDLRNEDLLEDYSIKQRYGRFGPETLTNFAVQTYNDGDLLSIIIPSSAHGTHVAGIIGANYPESPGRNGIAPGAQIISIKIGDTRLDGMETGIALQRALRMVKELDCDLINMSYGEPTSTPNKGWFIEQVNELIHEHGVTFVASAGNAGPALSTTGAPGGTTSSILAVGAYVHESMMAIQYGMAHTSQNNLYTWSSRGPTADGDLGVNFCAPGGAIAPVPPSSQVPAMQMNGTSMASPYACGAIGLILSGLKSEGKPYSPYGIRMAVEETAQIQEHLDSFSQGHGLIQINKAFENLQSTSESRSNIGFEIQNTNQSSERGIYLRENTPSITTHKLRIQPLFTKATKAHTKAIFENWAVLTCEATWVSSPDSVLINQKGGKVNVKVNSTMLTPGAHTTFIKGKDQFSGRTLFKIPVHAIVSSSLAGIDKTEWKKKLQLQPGEVQRVFLKPPSWAKWAEMRFQSNSSESNDRLVLHTAQLLRSQRFNRAEWKRYIPARSLSNYQASVPVHGNPMMEWTFASYWSNQSPIKLNVEIKFKGLEGLQQVYVMGSALIPIPANIQGVHDTIELQPQGSLTEVEFSLLPSNASIQRSSDPRDILVNDQELHRLDLFYKWENTQAGSLNVHWDALAEVLYDSSYSSLLWKVEGPNGRVLTYDDAWSHPIKINKGTHRISLTIWHEYKELLESFRKLPLNLSLPLSQSIPILTVTNLSAANGSKFETLDKDENTSYWISAKEMPKDNDTTSNIIKSYSGNLEWLDSKKHHGATIRSKVVVRPSNRPDPPIEKHDLHDSSNLNQDLETLWWHLRLDRLKHLAQMEGNPEQFDVLYDLMLKEKPHSMEIQKILLNRLDTQNRKENLGSILPLLEQMLQQLDKNTLRRYFSKRRQVKSKKEGEKENKMKEDRALLLNLLYRKARALAYQETVMNRQTKDFEETLANLRSWVDTSESDYRLLDIRELRRKDCFGSALTILNDSIKTDKDNLKLLKKRTNILQSLNWPFWAHYHHMHSYLRLPKQVISVEMSKTP
ncbi:S8 family serine peptidase [Verrucomicrobia bacterium]|nr:S8 family serine peptidase [Verrucomicrobiota bacterium]